MSLISSVKRYNRDASQEAHCICQFVFSSLSAQHEGAANFGGQEVRTKTALVSPLRLIKHLASPVRQNLSVFVGLAAVLRGVSGALRIFVTFSSMRPARNIIIVLG